MNMETNEAFKSVIQHNTDQTEKVLNALSELTNWMNTVQQSIDNIEERLRLAEKINKHRDNGSEFYITQDDFKQA